MTIPIQILGGDSSVNGLVWIRPPKADYDAFEQLGNPGWNWNTLYDASKKVHNRALFFCRRVADHLASRKSSTSLRAPMLHCTGTALFRLHMATMALSTSRSLLIYRYNTRSLSPLPPNLATTSTRIPIVAIILALFGAWRRKIAMPSGSLPNSVTV